MQNLIEIDNIHTFMLFTEECLKYEFTVTYNPKFIYSVDYAKTLTDDVIKDIVKLGKSVSKLKNEVEESFETFYFNYVVEYHLSGYPHIHGTLFTKVPIKPSTLFNWEQKFRRKYGRTDVYATGTVDKHHKNDHFEGTWQEYLRKEAIPRYFHCCPYYINSSNPIKFFS